MVRLGVNIDHVATLRQLRGTSYPSIVEAALLAEKAGADQITVHLREDRRHIQEHDVEELKSHLRIPLNLETALSPEIVKFASKVRPTWVCLVPERRKEITTEGGLNLKRNERAIGNVLDALRKKKIKTSLFIEPSVAAVKIAAKLGADAVELHTGTFSIATQSGKDPKTALEIRRLLEAAKEAHRSQLSCHAGHGLDYENVRLLAFEEISNAIPVFSEFNIGHCIVCRAALVGLDLAVRQMISALRAP